MTVVLSKPKSVCTLVSVDAIWCHATWSPLAPVNGLIDNCSKSMLNGHEHLPDITRYQIKNSTYEYSTKEYLAISLCNSSLTGTAYFNCVVVVPEPVISTDLSIAKSEALSAPGATRLLQCPVRRARHRVQWMPPISQCRVTPCLNPIMTWVGWFWYSSILGLASKNPNQAPANQNVPHIHIFTFIGFVYTYWRRNHYDDTKSFLYTWQLSRV